MTRKFDIFFRKRRGHLKKNINGCSIISYVFLLEEFNHTFSPPPFFKVVKHLKRDRRSTLVIFPLILYVLPG